jgi:hypothetical protein
LFEAILDLFLGNTGSKTEKTRTIREEKEKRRREDS